MLTLFRRRVLILVVAAILVITLSPRGNTRLGCTDQALASVAAPLTQCVGDCNSDSSVTINEVLTCVMIALGEQSLSVCPACSLCPLCDNPDPSVSDLILAVNNALDGCPQSRATPTPNPAAVIHYQLTEGSTISFAPLAPDLADILEPLSGSFELVPAPFPLPTPIEENALFRYVIVNIAFQSVHFTVTGNTGEFDGFTIPGPGQVSMQASVAINGQAVTLAGTSPLSVMSGSPGMSGSMISGLQISGGDSVGSYSLTIVATLEP